MRKNIVLFFAFLLSIATYAQDVLKVQPGAAITLQGGAQMTVAGDITLDDGSMLFNSGTVTQLQNGSGTTNFTDHTTTPYPYGAGVFVFNSTSGHFLFSNNSFGRIETGTTAMTFNSTITANQWLLGTGQINTGVYMAVVLGTTALDFSAALPQNPNFANGWINGTLRRFVDPANNDTYAFAVGGSVGNLAELKNMSAAPITGVQYIDASFSSKPGTDAGLAVTENGAQYIAVNPGGVWHFVPDNNPSAGTFNLQLFFDGFTGLTDNSFAILQRPNLSSAAADWKVPAGSSLNPDDGAGRMVSDDYALRNNVSSFGQFGIGQFTGTLPVTLTNFNAKRFSGSSVQLTWQTQTESNNRGFAIERRPETDNSFATAGFVNSEALNGNSDASLSYTFTDSNSYPGITYYRLKQTDLDNTGYYSLIKAVNGFNGSSVSVMLWPNPSKGQFSIRIDGNIGQKAIVITDMLSNSIRRIMITGNQQVDVYGLAAGTYVITIPNAMGVNENFNEKVVVVN